MKRQNFVMIFSGSHRPEIWLRFLSILQLGFTSPTEVAIIRDLNFTIAQVIKAAGQLCEIILVAVWDFTRVSLFVSSLRVHSRDFQVF